MEMTNANSLTRESAIQTVHDEVMLNAAYIDGKWMTIEAPATDTADADSYDSNYDLYDSNSGTIIATTRLCTKVQVEMAVNAASAAYPSWSQTAVARVHRISMPLPRRWRSSLTNWWDCLC